ncbi:leucine--tRNA ligase [Hymenobacter cheonanensis]|uniref:leucine--tRNA ligase n=1 Tax=Hymenobacter sp. CA2-7 TaxID=3063993 RepID=UPI00271428DF|nr:class I tRNA ligase family protein [Hymenobacter sp. CA2-7]MDO7883798.1 class I tRNA ligase family protein [Hymenobacter sp. CA2-7]
MPAYRPQELEKKWQDHWQQHHTFRADNASDKPKYYVLDMFPYPSGAGLHVGHPLGYIASDIVARYQRLQGRNVLHPMGFDSFGLPAEQYAIQTGQHPAVTTEKNIETYIRQLQQLGFSYDWEREVRTSDPSYYKWTQWIFLQLFNSWYNLDTDRAEHIRTLQEKFAESGSAGIRAAGDDADRHDFTAGQWQSFTEKQKLAAILPYRLAYQQDTYVNWCAALGTVLSNDEVKDGLSERGGYPVERRLMPQWNLRITAYADRLLKGLDTLDWPDAVKEMQRNWIGKSIGAEVSFPVLPAGAAGEPAAPAHRTSGAASGAAAQPNRTSGEAGHGPAEATGTPGEAGRVAPEATGRPVAPAGSPPALPDAPAAVIKVYTTRVDTIYGATFLVLAPEHELVDTLTTPAQRGAVDEYIAATKRRSERDRMADVKTVSGVFTGAYAANPVDGTPVPIWLADYVLAGYGTGAVMAVPSGDQRDYLFAKHFDLPIPAISDAQKDLDQQADPTKEGRYINSGIVNGLGYKEATATLIAYLEEKGLGKGKVNFRLRDAIFGRQRYWGEPIPIYYKDGTAYGVAEADLPLVLPEIDEYKPTETGEPPLGRAKDWKYKGQYEFELSTMPGWAGSSWYYLRYMDPHNADRFVGEAAEQYWGQVDLYMGGAEHATGHLLYSRFWYLFLKDLGLVTANEPFQKLINQGMILGRSNFVYRLNASWSAIGAPDEIEEDKNHSFPPIFVSKNIVDELSKPHSKGDSIVKYFDLELAKIGNNNGGTVRPAKHGENYAYFTPLHVDVSIVNNDVLDTSAFKKWRPDYNLAEFVIEEDGRYVSGWEVEKMSKAKFNVVNPDVLVAQYGADALRLYEMFLGPLEQFKPWNTNGISGVATFLKKFWRLFHPEDGALAVTDEPASPAELKTLHRVIQKVAQDVEKFSFNTSVSTFMIAVNELTALGTHKRAILEPLVILLSPFAPHLAEELWEELGHFPGSISYAQYPEFREEYLVEANVTYPVAINGKVREQRQFAATATASEIETAILESDFLARFGDGKAAKKVVVVPGRMVNVVV